MSAADEIMSAVKALVEGAFPGKQVKRRRASDKNPINAADMTYPCFAASVNDARPTKMLCAGKKQVRYTVELVYLTREPPGVRDAGTGPAALGGDIEDALAAAARLFLVPRTAAGKPGLEGAPAVTQCGIEPDGPYKLPTADQTLNCSAIRLTFDAVEDA